MQQLLAVNITNKDGFTLIEFCVAVLIMMVGLLGLLQAVNLATEHNLKSMLRNEALTIAEEQMVNARVSVINSDAYAALTEYTGFINRKSRGGFSNYSVVRTVSTVSANSKEVVVRVSWRYKGTKLNHTVSTFITNPAPQ
jgi:type IV pilus assembly protein PilV